MNAFILLPQNAPEAYADRLTLWNAAESAEKRKNSRVAREVILALPHELSEDQRLALTRDMALFLVEKYRVAVDAAVHAPQEAHGDDPRNHHAHLLFLTRMVQQDGLGEKTRILDDKEQGPAQIELIRQVWEKLANAALQRAGLKGLRIDRRTLEDQGIDRIPQEHVGKAGTHADDEEKPGQKQDEEDEDGETDTGKGKAGTGDSRGQAPSATKKEPSSASNEKAAPAKPRAETRLGLNEEIIKLNAQRAAFSPVPLKDQIKELDKLMDRLDGRVQRLKVLSQKTSLPERVLRLVISVFHAAKFLLVIRTKDEAQRTIFAAEREAKAERQRARYGTTYRASVYERMAEMRENIEILQTRKAQYYNYKSFVEMVEQRVNLVQSTLKSPALPVKTEWKATTSAEAVKTKTVIEAKQAREKIPVEYRTTVKQEGLVKSFKRALANSASLVAFNNSTNPTTAIIRGEDSKRPDKPFTVAATPTKDNDRSVWYKEVKIQIKWLDQARSEITPIPIKDPMDSPKVWRVEANDKGKIILERMQADIRERKAEVHKLSDSNFSGKFNHPNKTATEDEVIQKVRKEAKVARASVPPEMREDPYDYVDSKKPQESGFSNKFKAAGQATLEESKFKMSFAFNRACNTTKSEEGPSSTGIEPRGTPKPS